ncbi:MAG: hypothetical protein ACLFS2_02400 [Halochromatium sp.]|uniref:hypothetical protein n=1 Tax=Halochromatium sp. TaxID=2049430 RepID=UPI00397B95D8
MVGENPLATTPARNQSGKSSPTSTDASSSHSSAVRKTVPSELRVQFEKLQRAGQQATANASHSLDDSPLSTSTQAPAGAAPYYDAPGKGLADGAMSGGQTSGTAAEMLSVAEIMGQASSGTPAEAVPIAPAEPPPSGIHAAPAMAAGMATQTSPAALAELFGRRIRRLLLNAEATQGDSGGKVLVTLEEGPLAGAEVWLEKTSGGWQLDARIDDPDIERRLEDSADALRERFAQAGLGELSIRLDNRDGHPGS